MLPDWLDITVAENTAAAKVRDLRGQQGVWGELIASAQAVIDYFEDFDPEQIRTLFDEEKSIPLIGAARILDAASRADGVPETDRFKLAIAASVAFGMYGNSLSALAVANRVIESVEAGGSGLSRNKLVLGEGEEELINSESLNGTLAVALATAAPRILGKVLPWCDDGSKDQVYLERLGEYLRTGDARQVDSLRSALIDCLMEADVPFAEMLLFASRLCLEHAIVLSTAAVLATHWPGCPPAFVKSLIDGGIPLLLPPQYKAIVEKKLLTESGNALIALPTSAGKTLLGELCLIGSLGDRPGLVCYLAPYVALGQQIATTFRRHLPRTLYRVHALVGGHKGEVKLDPTNNLEVVIATPERLDLLLRSMPDVVKSIRCIVCDEAHMIQNDKRGVKLEGLLARIRLQQNKGNALQVVLVSAVLPEYDRLKRWMGVADNRVITDSWRPTARRLAIWRQSGQLTWHIGADPLRAEGANNADILGVTTLVWPKSKLYGANNPGALISQEPDIFENVAYLVDTVRHRYGGGPILCSCASKHNSRRLAWFIAARLKDLEPMPPTILSVVSLIVKKYKVLQPLVMMLRRGVAYHNASLPHDVRARIEEAVSSQELTVVTATTTLAEGVDLPFRFTILADWLTWDSSMKQRPMDSLLFRNIAGRCGRAGVMTEGDTIIFDNPVGDLAHTNPYQRGDTQLDLYVNPPKGELQSALGAARTGTDEYETCQEELSSQFLAAVPENPEEDDLAETFASNLYSTLEPAIASRVRNHLIATRASVLDNSREALAMAASPLKLTAFGRAALCTSFSPNSCRAILEYLRGEEPPATAAELGHHLLVKLGTLPEQYHEKLRKILAGKKNHQFSIRLEDLAGLLQMWIAGVPIDEMFLSLPVHKRSSKKPKIDVWAAGIDEPTKWDDDFDKFCDAVNQVFKDFIPWLMFACDQLSGIANGWSDKLPWELYSDFYEAGVDSAWAVRLMRSDAIVERRAAAAAGRKIPEEWLTERDPLALAGLRSKRARQEVFDTLITECIDDAGGEETEAGKELLKLRTEILKLAGLEEQ